MLEPTQQNSFTHISATLLVKTQCGTIKKHFREFEKYANQSGFGMDENGMVTGPPEALSEYYASNPQAKQIANGPLPLYDDLLTLFGRKYCIVNFCEHALYEWCMA